MHDIVKQGTVQVDYTIYQYTFEDGTVGFEWVDNNGDDDDTWYESIEEAESAVLRHYGV
jgi:hypothetical protein